MAKRQLRVVRRTVQAPAVKRAARKKKEKPVTEKTTAAATKAAAQGEEHPILDVIDLKIDPTKPRENNTVFDPPNVSAEPAAARTAPAVLMGNENYEPAPISAEPGPDPIFAAKQKGGAVEATAAPSKRRDS